MPVVPKDELFEKYLKKAITEINDLGHEIVATGDGPRAVVLGSGHPLAAIMLHFVARCGGHNARHLRQRHRPERPVDHQG